jgi:uncharacterized membrane protein YgaE (UPF0421/DUF939 family)
VDTTRTARWLWRTGGHDGLVQRPLDRSAALGRRVARRGRSTVQTRVLRLRQRAFLICQVAVAAAVAWYLAHDVLGHQRPFFAPVAAIVCLGMSYGQRLRRVVEVTAGVAVGVGVADLLVRLIGTGPWQIALVVVLSMAVAVLLDGGALIVTQAAVQSVVVATLLPAASAGFSRWVDAVLGGAVALAAAAVAPQSPLRRPRMEAGRVLDELADVLHDAAHAARAHDVDAAEQALARARATDAALADLRSAAAEGLEVVRSSPFRRRQRAHVERVAEIAEPIDRAVRNSRVLARRISAAVRYDEPVPATYLDVLDDLAEVVGDIADTLTARGQVADRRAALERIARETAVVPHAEAMSAVVVLAQVRSIVVDLLELTGLDQDQAMARIPRPA